MMKAQTMISTQAVKFSAYLNKLAKILCTLYMIASHLSQTYLPVATLLGSMVNNAFSMNVKDGQADLSSI